MKDLEINRLAREEALRVVPEYRLDPRAYETDFQRAFSQAWMRYSLLEENSPPSTRFKALSVKEYLAESFSQALEGMMGTISRMQNYNERSGERVFLENGTGTLTLRAIEALENSAGFFHFEDIITNSQFSIKSWSFILGAKR